MSRLWTLRIKTNTLTLTSDHVPWKSIGVILGTWTVTSLATFNKGNKRYWTDIAWSTDRSTDWPTHAKHGFLYTKFYNVLICVGCNCFFLFYIKIKDIYRSPECLTEFCIAGTLVFYEKEHIEQMQMKTYTTENVWMRAKTCSRLYLCLNIDTGVLSLWTNRVIQC